MKNHKLAVALLGMATAGACLAAGHAPKPEPDVSILVQTDGQPGAAIRALAEMTATEMFAKIGVRAVWVADAKGSGAATGVVLHLRITDEPQDGRPPALGYAHTFANSTKSSIVIMWDRILTRSGGVPMLAPTLLAHVMVHEVTHVLQRVVRHSDEGIMKTEWSREDIESIHWQPLAFTEEDVRLIQSGLAGLRKLTIDAARSH